MGSARLGLSVVAVACLVSSGTDAAPARQRATAQPAPQTREALFLACRRAVFRKFGWNSGAGQVVMYRDFASDQVDLCVRNGGRI